jgi:hypothetical protein
VVDVTPEGTPNPNALKFTLDRAATDKRSETFRAGSDPESSPLGHRIFQIDGVTNVFLTSNFVSVNKEDGADWDDIVPEVVDAIQTHFAG